MGRTHGISRLRPGGALSMAVILLSLALLAQRASASLIWDGDASRGTGIFGLLNCASPGSVTAVDDATQGRVWRYYKPSGSNRCENHGIKVNGSTYHFSEGNTYYLGWRSKLTSTVDNNATFQWKSYGNHIQNYPILLKMIGGKIHLMYRAPNESCCRTLWSTPISANTWYHYVIGIRLSSSASSGWIEFWFNGVQQTLSNGSTRYPGRTLDDINEPKWGIYGAESSTVTSYVDALKVGMSYSDVSAGGGGPTATRTRTSTPCSSGCAPTATRTRTRTRTSTTSSGSTTWAPGISYSVGATVTYAGVTYRCVQAHTSQVGWEPPNVPALWQRI